MSTHPRNYYSIRTGKQSSAVAFDALKKIVYTIYNDFKLKDYFYEYFGSFCVDLGNIPGKVGQDINSYALKKLRKDIWPFSNLDIESYSEEDLFDIIEFLFDHISKPLEEGGSYHSYENCGWHYINFDQETGQKEFILEINQFLKDYSVGYELNNNGEILNLGDPQLKHLLEASLPTYDPENVDEKIILASEKFRKYGSSLSDRVEAVRILADCLEFIRPEIKKTISNKDEADLFNIANNFGIRHHNTEQKINYDKNIWLSWMFYFYLASLHAFIRIIKKKKGKITI